MKIKAQGTIEYLVILAIVVVIALVVVGLLIGIFNSPSQQISSSGNSLGLSTQAIGITESLIEPNDGNYVIRLLNNSGENLTVSNVKIGDTNVLFSEDLAQGSERLFVVNTNVDCSLGKIVSEDVVVSYVTRDGLTKVERYPIKVMFNCTPYVVNVNLVADQCPTCEVCADPVELHTGQTLSYDTGALDDKDKDGVAKSYTDNLNGTIKDNHTGLVWQKGNNGAGIDWETALTYCANLANGAGGLTDGSSAGDWRLPSAVEGATLIDYGRADYKNPVFTWGYNFYWTGTTLPSDADYAYILRFEIGFIYNGGKTDSFSYRARCVRDP